MEYICGDGLWAVGYAQRRGPGSDRDSGVIHVCVGIETVRVVRLPVENFAVRGQWGKDGTLRNPTFRRQAEEETTEETRKEVKGREHRTGSEQGWRAF